MKSKKTYKNIISNKTFSFERALYAISDCLIEKCKFEGEEDGESALKEGKNFTVKDSDFLLRYPLWHAKHFSLQNCIMTDTARAAIWYADVFNVVDSTLGGIKAVRECSNGNIVSSKIKSPEFGWKSKYINCVCSEIESEYAFLDSSNIKITDVNFKGKYSFQYTKNVEIKNSVLDTKDAFWHSKNVTVRDSEIKGEYLGWYSEGLTLINCKIVGTQPLCYAKNLTLINCTMESCDLAFEYSSVKATVLSKIDSVKNPKSGKIVAAEIGEIIKDNSIYNCKCKIKIAK